jgi:hypothetical protein
MSTRQFHISTGSELLAIRHRVRNLITHWGEDGRYKEVVVKSVIKRFLREDLAIGTGFVVRPIGHRKVSRDLDTDRPVDL